MPAATPPVRRSRGRSSPRSTGWSTTPGIEVVEHALVVDLLTAADGAVCGVTLHVIGEGQVDGVGAAYGRAVVLATGGSGQIYTSTTNPPVATGDGMAAALRAGAGVTDLEFVQFHPTVLYLGEGSTGQQPLISEALRGEGAFLVDDDGARFMPAAGTTSADLAPRDVVARAILDVMQRLRRRARLARCPPPRPGVPRGTVPVDRLPLSRAGLRPGDGAVTGGAGPALRVGWGGDRPDGAVLRRRAVRVRRVLVHRGPRGQPAGVELAPRGARLRPPDRRRRHRADRGGGAPAPRAGPGCRRGRRARRGAPSRAPAGDDPRCRTGEVRAVDGRGPRAPRRPRRAGSLAGRARSPRRGRRRTSSTWVRHCPSWRTCGRRPAAGTCARTSPNGTTPGGSPTSPTSRAEGGALDVTERPVDSHPAQPQGVA